MRSPAWGSSCGHDINLQVALKRSQLVWKFGFSFINKGVGPNPGAATVWGGTAYGACVAASAHTASGLGREATAGQAHGALTMWEGISVEQENLLHKSQDFKKKKEVRPSGSVG